MTIGTMVNENMSSQNLFERNVIECPSTWKGTFDAGYLIPVFWCPTLPGDTFKLDATFFCRLSTQVLPPMDNIYLDWHFYWSADRFVWDNFAKFFGEKENPEDSIDYLVPQINSGDSGFDYETPFDYCGCPPAVPNYDVDSLLFRHQNLIWNQWYRAELIQNSLPVPKGDGPDPLVQVDGSPTFPLLPRGKRGDYFTLGLPNPYSMSSGPVTLSLGESAPVVEAGGENSFVPKFYSSGVLVDFNRNLSVGTSAISGNGSLGFQGLASGDFNPLELSLKADLSNAIAPTINSLRQAIALQHFLEMEQRSGSRYIELMYGAFGVLNSNRALQRPEFLGGTTTMINVNVVPQTSSTNSTSPQGNLSAYSTSSGTGIGFTRSFEEHGFVIGFVSARTDLTYQQGLDRLLSKRTRYDYYWNQLAHLGEQAVLNKEIYVQSNDVVDDDGVPVNEGIFSYMPRYSEYRFKNSLITGRFRSSYPQSLDAYHYSEYFGELPKLNEDFIKVPAGTTTDSLGNVVYKDPIKRTLAVQDEPDFMLDVYFDLTKITEVDIYGTPGLTRL